MNRQAARRKFHYIYKITRNDGSGKYYIGMHSSDSLDDGYFGSGKIITASIKKHGMEKHTKEILEFLPTREALKLREKELVNEELLGDKRCMNLKLGGEGGFDHLNDGSDSHKARAKKAGLLGGMLSRARLIELNKSDERKHAQREVIYRLKAEGKMLKTRGTTGLKFSDQTKNKMSAAQVADKNPMFGMMWIHNTKEKSSKRIKKGSAIPEGWFIGRKTFK
jgi:hypothetical protein